VSRVIAAVIAAGALLAGTRGAAQTVPDGSQASKTQQAYRRTPSFRNDPFRHVSIPHWGFVFSSGASAANNALNLSDMRAVKYLSDQDSLRKADALDLINLVPRGAGLRASAQGEGGFYLGGPFGSHLSFGISARGSGYGSFHIDDQAVSLLRDGNGTGANFSLGTSKGGGLATAEGGAHAIIRLGPMGSPDGVRVNLGFGGRYLRPGFYARAGSTLSNGGTILITPDSIAANVAVEELHTPDLKQTIKGSGHVADFLLRLEWPTQGLAIEAMVANVGKVRIPGVERRTANINVNSTNLVSVSDALDTASFAVKDTIVVNATMPRIVRFSASSWANKILQLDISATLPVTGEFDSPLFVDLGTTWRLIRTIPLRAGVVLGGNQGLGYTGAIAIEGRTMFLQLAAQSLGGFARKATGVGARLELGLFF
jgi:hypothetical protein